MDIAITTNIPPTLNLPPGLQSTQLQSVPVQGCECTLLLGYHIVRAQLHACQRAAPELVATSEHPTGYCRQA